MGMGPINCSISIEYLVAILLFLFVMIGLFLIFTGRKSKDLTSRTRRVVCSTANRGTLSERGNRNMPRYYRPKEIKESGRDWAEAVLKGADPKPRSEADCQAAIEHAKGYADYAHMMQDLSAQTNSDALHDAFRSGVLEAIRDFR